MFVLSVSPSVLKACSDVPQDEKRKAFALCVLVRGNTAGRPQGCGQDT